MADAWDNALDWFLRQQGAQNPRVIGKQDYPQGQKLYTVEADAWGVPSQYGAGNERIFTVWTDGMGSANVGEVGLTPRP